MKRSNMRFNLIDIFICLIILFVTVFYSLYLYNVNHNNVAVYDTYYFVVIEGEKLKFEYIDDIKVGDPVIDSKGTLVGEVNNVEFYEYYEQDQSETEFVAHPEFRNIKITLKCLMQSKGEYYLTGDDKIVVGETYDFFVPKAFISGKCVSVTKI